MKAKTWKAKYSRLNDEQKRKFKSLFQGLSKISSQADFSANEWILDSPTREFLKYIRDNVKIDDFVNKSLTELKGIDAAIKRDGRFGDFTNKTSGLYKNVYHAFVELGYEKNIKKDKFIDAIGIKVCPYCNRAFIQNVAAGKKSVVKGELDHFLSKEDHPYLAICKYNLVPSCPFCNHVKRNQNKPNLRSPYDLTDANGIKFRMTITGHDFPNIEKCANAITILVEDNGSGNASMQDNIEQFHLKEVYQTHTDYAAEIYYMGKLKLNSKYLYNIRRRLKKLQMGITKDEVDRLLLGFYTNPRDFGNRPLSKFRYDLAVDEGLI